MRANDPRYLPEVHRGAVGLVLAAVVVLLGAAGARAQDGPSGTMIVSNMDGRSISLIDLPSGVSLATLPTVAAPHEVAVSADGATAVVTNYGAPGDGNLLQVVDIRSATLLREMVVGGRTRLHGVAFLPGDSLLALTSEATAEVLVVSAADGSLRRAMPTGGGAPHMLALGGPWIWVANIQGGSLARIDPSALEATRTWPAGTRTEGVAATPDGEEGWTGSMDAGTVVGVSASGEVVARVTGLGVPYRLAVTPDARTVVVSDPGLEQVVLIDRAAGAIAANVDVRAASVAAGLGREPSPQGFTLTPDGRWALVSAKAIDRVALVDLREGSVRAFFETGDGPDGIGFSPVRVSPGRGR